MANPGGNYPGRQIWIGSIGFDPAFAYLVTGRSDASKARYATPYIDDQNAIRMERTNPKEPFDIFRHYQAVRIDPTTGLLLVSNNQACVDPIFEAYLCRGMRKTPAAERARKILAAIGPEYDSKEKPTSRVIGVIAPETNGFGSILGVTSEEDRAFVVEGFPCVSIPKFRWVQTYNGEVDYENFNPDMLKDTVLSLGGATNARVLADGLYDMTDYVDQKYGELRVCTIAGVKNGNGPGGWELATRNRHQVK